MFEIINGTINITRGDTAYINVNVMNRTTGKYILQDGDVVKFSVKKTINDTTPLIQKQLIDNKIKILPTDTALLPFGSYVYDIQLTFANGDVNTIVKPNRFEVCDEVT